MITSVRLAGSRKPDPAGFTLELNGKSETYLTGYKKFYQDIYDQEVMPVKSLWP